MYETQTYEDNLNVTYIHSEVKLYSIVTHNICIIKIKIIPLWAEEIASYMNLLRQKQNYVSYIYFKTSN